MIIGRQAVFDAIGRRQQFEDLVSLFKLGDVSHGFLDPTHLGPGPPVFSGSRGPGRLPARREGRRAREDGLSGVYRPGDVAHPRLGPGHGPLLRPVRQRPPGEGPQGELGGFAPPDYRGGLPPPAWAFRDLDMVADHLVEYFP